MEIPVKAKVYCAGDPCGRSTCVIIHSATLRVTHLVVRAESALHTERLVPVEMILETTLGSIRLRCTEEELARMEPFIETEGVEVDPYDYGLLLNDRLERKYLPGPCWMQLQHRRIPTGGMAVAQSTRVRAASRIVGRMDRFVVDTADGCITHLVLCKGHLWRRATVTVAVAQIESVGEDAVRVKLDKGSPMPNLKGKRTTFFSRGPFGPLDAELLRAKDGIEGVIRALGCQEDARIRQAAARALGQNEDSRAVKPLIAALEDTVAPVKEVAAASLGKIGDPQAVVPLLALLKKESAAQRRCAAEALGEIGDPRAVEPLIGVLRDTCCRVRIAATKALGEIGDPRAVEPLVAALGDGDTCIRLAAASALSKIGPP